MPYAITRNAPSSGTLDLSQETGTRATWLHLSGELDLASASRLERALHVAHRDSLLVVLDPRGLTFIDCAGLRVIMDATARARGREGSLLLVAGSPLLERLLALTGTQDRVIVFDAEWDSDSASGSDPRAPLRQREHGSSWPATPQVIAIATPEPSEAG